MKDYDKGVVADVFKRIGMPTNMNCYETAEHIHKAVLRAYFLGISDAKNNTLIKSKSK
jgi:hypothetical protein